MIPRYSGIAQLFWNPILRRGIVASHVRGGSPQGIAEKPNGSTLESGIGKESLPENTGGRKGFGDQPKRKGVALKESPGYG